MKKRTRTILFFLCIVFFLLATPLIVLYSQGYRFDFDNKKVVQTGAFYFKVFPKSAEIYLDGKLKKKTSALTGSILIENLLPKTYEIEIKQEGFHPWQKNLEIKEKQVTEAKNIILFPENPKIRLLSSEKEEINNTLSKINVEEETKKEIPQALLDSTYKDFRFSPDGKKIVYFNDYEIWLLFLEDQYDQPQKRAGDKVFLTRFSEKINNVLWLTSHYLIFNVGGKIRTLSPDGSGNLVFSPYSNIKIIETDDRDRINIVNLPIVSTQAESEEPKIFWNKNNKQLYILSSGSLYGLGDLLP